MKSRLFIAAFLALALPISVQAQPTYKPAAPADFKVPAADLEKWATRIKKLCPSEGWTVSVENNDVLIVRGKPVGFSTQRVNAHWGTIRSRVPLPEGIYQIRLRFGPPMSLDKYEELKATNRVAEIAKDDLLRKYKLDEIYGHVFVLTDEEKANLMAYNEEAKKLTFHRLPLLYTPDYSITKYNLWSLLEYLNSRDKNIDTECKAVEASIAKFFGNFDPIGYAEKKMEKN